MKSRTPLRWVIAASLGALLASCSTTRYASPSNAEELPRFVLILQETPDGQVTHAWQRAEEVDLSPYRYRASAGSSGTNGRIVLAAAWTRDCEEELIACHRDCEGSPLPRHLRHIPRRSPQHREYCTKKCQVPYIDCCRLRELQVQEFTAIDSAVDWLKRHRKELLAGGVVVVIAGVVFVVVSAGAGLIVLAPLALVVSP